MLAAVIGLALVFPGAGASPVPPGEESDSKCARVIYGEYDGSEVHADVYISDVTLKDGRLYVNGEPYPKHVLNHLEKAYGYISDNDSDLLDPDHPNHPTNPNSMNPILNPLRNAVLGPFEEFMEDLDPEELPTVEVAVWIPTPAEEPPGVHLRVIADLQVCSEPDV